MSDDSERAGPDRRTVIAGAVAAGAAWTVPVVLSSTPAGAQASGCVLLDVTSVGICTETPGLPYAVQLTASVAGCASGDFRLLIRQDQTVIDCSALPPGGGLFVTISAESPRTNVLLTIDLYAGTTCTGSLIGTDTVVVSTPLQCGPSGAPVAEVDPEIPVVRFP